MFKWLTICLLTPALIACSGTMNIFGDESFEEEPAQTAISQPKFVSSFRIYLEKGFMGRTDFEQFSLSGKSLFFECGLIRNGKGITESQEILLIDQQLSGELFLNSLEILGIASETNPASLKPLTNPKLYSKSGLSTLQITTADHKTAQISLGFGRLTMPKNSLEEHLADLISSVRKIVLDEKGSDALCSNENFHGL